MQTLLASGIEQMAVPVSNEMQVKLLHYLELLAKWNGVYNLTAIKQKREMVILHLLDSLSVLPYIKGANILDVGSGAGLPGVVLAIVNPTLQVTTIDAVQKKTIFMRHVKGELALDNLQIIHGRVEELQSPPLYDQIISRAFSDINLFLKLTAHLISDGGEWLAMKGLIPHVELQSVKIQPAKIIDLKVAHLEAERHLIVFENVK
jgi:16S rRNA (guanine527-N7)-methyltransferase